MERRPQGWFWEGEGTQQVGKVCPSVASPPCSRFLSSSKHRVWRVCSRIQPCMTPTGACCSLLCSVAIPHLLPWLLAGFSSSAASSFQPQQLQTGSSQRAAPFLPLDIWLLIWRSGYGWQDRRLSPFLLHPSSTGASIPFVYVREFCELMACVHAAQESKPSQGGGHSISRESIHVGINPCGAGIHPTTGEAAPHFARERGKKLCLPCFMA